MSTWLEVRKVDGSAGYSTDLWDAVMVSECLDQHGQMIQSIKAIGTFNNPDDARKFIEPPLPPGLAVLMATTGNESHCHT